MSRPTETEIDTALSVLRADYYSSVRSIAEEIAAEAIETVKQERTLYLGSLITSAVDGADWVIYTHKADRVLLCSDNADYGFEEGGADVLKGCTSQAEVAVRLAFWALFADVSEQVEALMSTQDGAQ